MSSTHICLCSVCPMLTGNNGRCLLVALCNSDDCVPVAFELKPPSVARPNSISVNKTSSNVFYEHALLTYHARSTDTRTIAPHRKNYALAAAGKTSLTERETLPLPTDTKRCTVQLLLPVCNQLLAALKFRNLIPTMKTVIVKPHSLYCVILPRNIDLAPDGHTCPMTLTGIHSV